MAKTFVLGDIHGAHRALKQCLQRSAFDYEKDHLISLGDVTDGWPETKESISELLKVSNLTYILGNHDLWTLEWMETGEVENLWLNQGGKATLESYVNGRPESHRTFLRNALPYFLLEEKLFVHAGVNPLLPLEANDNDTFLWDRNLARIALDFYSKGIETKLTSFEEVYIGHTPIPFDKPIHSCGVWMMDTGAGWSGALSIMNIETKEIFTSDPVPSLYPGIPGRKRY